LIKREQMGRIGAGRTGKFALGVLENSILLRNHDAEKLN